MKNNKIKIVVDTNVFVNGMIFSEEYINDTKTLAILLDLIENETIEIVFSQDTIGELMYIMKNKVMHYIKEEEQISFMSQLVTLFFYSYSVNTEFIYCKECKDKKDVMFIKCAIKGRANYIITNDYKSGLFAITKYKFKTINCEELIKLVEKKDGNNKIKENIKDDNIEDENNGKAI